ncbi:AAA family ATPase [Candidatus Kaiserbacteria bacterium]|nr:AAA family ATPase [Candidatus Kaiserbacteria bacterium]MCB9818315.1 AAA family ATPase [Candidatus Nomurabacteria bacterium]
MKKKHIITLSGKPGSGKSSTADKVAELLNYTRHSSGDMVRQILAKSHMTLEEYNQKAETDHDLDDKVDEQLRALRDKKDIVVDSRLGFYWIPESFKVYLDLDLEIATARIFKDTVSNSMRKAVGTSSSSLSDVSRQVKERMLNEQSRFKAMYGVDPYNKNNFDFVIDTSRQNPQSVAIAVFDAYREWLDSEVWEPRHNEVPLGYSYKNQY